MLRGAGKEVAVSQGGVLGTEKAGGGVTKTGKQKESSKGGEKKG